MAIKRDIVSALKTAIRSKESVPCPYPDFDNPANWERYEGADYHDFKNGEVALIAWEDAGGSYGWTFRNYEEETKMFHRIGGHFYMGWHPQSDRWSQYIIYRYVGGADTQAEIPCLSLEGVL